jgi:hypothetical protein
MPALERVMQNVNPGWVNFNITMVPLEERKISQQELMVRARQMLRKYQGARISVSGGTDISGAATGRGGPGGGGPGGGGFRTMTEEEVREMFGDADPFSDFFHTFFGGAAPGEDAGRRARGARGRGPRHGRDVEQEIELVALVSKGGLLLADGLEVHRVLDGHGDEVRHPAHELDVLPCIGIRPQRSEVERAERAPRRGQRDDAEAFHRMLDGKVAWNEIARLDAGNVNRLPGYDPCSACDMPGTCSAASSPGSTCRTTSASLSSSRRQTARKVN